MMGLGLLLIAVSGKLWWIMVIGTALTGFGYGVMQPLIYAKTSAISPPRKSKLALSFVMAVNYLAIMICPFVVDFLRGGFGFKSDISAFWINGLIVVGFAVYIYFRRDKSFVLGGYQGDV